jgi:hypothetical protein
MAPNIRVEIDVPVGGDAFVLPRHDGILFF